MRRKKAGRGLESPQNQVVFVSLWKRKGWRELRFGGQSNSNKTAGGEGGEFRSKASFAGGKEKWKELGCGVGESVLTKGVDQLWRTF